MRLVFDVPAVEEVGEGFGGGGGADDEVLFSFVDVVLWGGEVSFSTHCQGFAEDGNILYLEQRGCR